jgi:hypothetical protein
MKISPKLWFNPFLVKIHKYVAFSYEKVVQILGICCNLQKNCKKYTIAHKAKICLKWLPWGRSYDHNFLRFSAIFGNFRQFSAKQLAFFSKTNVMINFFAKVNSSLSKKRQFFRQFFGRKKS